MNKTTRDCLKEAQSRSTERRDRANVSWHNEVSRYDFCLAQLGYYVLELLCSEEGAPIGLLKHPVIRWMTDLDNGLFIPEPVTLSGPIANSSLFDAPILAPCGLVLLGTDVVWDNEDEYLWNKKEEYVNAQAARQHRQENEG